MEIIIALLVVGYAVMGAYIGQKFGEDEIGSGFLFFLWPVFLAAVVICAPIYLIGKLIRGSK